MRHLLSKIQNWYKGKYHPTQEQMPDGSLAVREQPYYEKSLSAKIVTRVFKFWLDHWRWILMFAVAIITAYITYLKK